MSVSSVSSKVVTILEVGLYRFLQEKLMDDDYESEWVTMSYKVTDSPLTELVYDRFCDGDHGDEMSSEGLNLSPEDEKLFESVSEFITFGTPFGTDKEMTDVINKFLQM